MYLSCRRRHRQDAWVTAVINAAVPITGGNDG